MIGVKIINSTPQIVKEGMLSSNVRSLLRRVVVHEGWSLTVFNKGRR